MPTLLVLAAGLGSRYGGNKQWEEIGPSGERLLDYAIWDAMKCGFGKVVFVVRPGMADKIRNYYGPLLEGKMQVEIAEQRLQDLPVGVSLPDGRSKPWGTGHAVWAARNAIDQPFAVINADDFYGPYALGQLAVFLTQVDRHQAHFVMVGYPLSSTLSDHGPVNRGLVGTKAGKLVSLEEKLKISRVGDQLISAEAGREMKLDENALVSMNCWGFTPVIFEQLEQGLLDFFGKEPDSATSEFYLPALVDQIIGEGRASCRVIPGKSEWFGLTYREDRTAAQAALQGWIERGHYPANLWA